MKYLNVPVPETVTASYLVPLTSPITEAGARERIAAAVWSRLDGTVRDVVLTWLACEPSVIEILGPLPEPVSAEGSGSLERLSEASGFVRITAVHRPTLIALHELRARGAAAALAADINDAPVIDVTAEDVLTASDALASLPQTRRVDGPEPLIGIALSVMPWVKIHDLMDRGTYWAWSAGMRRFGLPEFRVGGCERDLREELKQILLALVHRIVCDVFARPGVARNIDVPNPVKIPAEFMLSREDLDNARGESNRGGGCIEVALRLSKNGSWLTVYPPDDPIYWEFGWEDYIANLCHVMFAFEKPHWHYLPGMGAAFKALESLPGARNRLATGDLPPGARFLVRYQAEDDELRWARADSWDEDTATIRDIGRELSPGVRPGPPRSIAASLIRDWAVWADSQGVIEGAVTETIG
jgi:hypothetical protein